MSNFINIHVLISPQPFMSEPRRYEHAERRYFRREKTSKISSQSLKRAMRKSDYYAQNIGESVSEQFILHNYVMFFGKKSERFDQKSSIRH